MTVAATTNPVDQFRSLMQIAKVSFAQPRYEKLEKLYEHFAERILVTPASGKTWHHCAYPGGYLDHVLNVVNGVTRVSLVMAALGMEIDFTKEEAIFAAMHHDLGKLGDLTEPYYIPQGSVWHQDNRGEMFTINPKLPKMTVTDRALWLLQHFEVKVTDKEWKAIKLSDGLYDDANKSYLNSYSYPPQPFHTNLIHAVHFADIMACYGEKDRERANG